jgi:biopolymer transport protein ExbB/TolQ/DNA-directed RNA polymerase subunit RPC12/RpoP
MSLRITCPHCKYRFTLDDGATEEVTRCPDCGQRLKIKPRAASSHSSNSSRREPDLDRPAAANAKKSRSVETDSDRADDAPFADEQPLFESADPVEEEEFVGLPLTAAERNSSRLASLFRFFFGTTNPTDVSFFLTGILAAAVTAILYFEIVPRFLANAYIGDLIDKRGWVARATVLFFIWAVTMMLAKYLKLIGQKRALSLSLLPDGDKQSIRPANIKLLQANLRYLCPNIQGKFLVNRIFVALEHFKVRKNVQEVGTVLSAQADIDAARVDSSYTLLKVFIWAIPILGFVGTVVGISDAVRGFTGTIQTAQKLDDIKEALGQVTQGLAVAFDTTLISLVLSIFIMFPANSLQKSEEDLLSSIDQYCHERLLRNLKEDPVPVSLSHPPPAALPENLHPVLQQLSDAVGLLLTELRSRSEPEVRMDTLRRQEQTLAQAMKDHLTLISGVSTQILSSLADGQVKPEATG